MQQRRGTQAQWSAANPILAAGEIGFETDTSKFKMGNGSSTWSALQYFANAAELAAIVDGAPGLLNTLDELAQAIGDDPAFFTTTTNNLALKAPIANPTFTGTVGGVTKSMVGLGNVDNTSDANKPVSSATATELALKETVANVALKAPLASPALTGVPTAPTADTTTNTTQIATTQFVQTKVNELIDAAPGALNTLNELAAAIADDENYAATLATSVGTKVSKAGDTMTGALALSGAPTEPSHATTKTYVDGQITSAGTTAQGYVDIHNTATLNVHGIANTANLATLEDLSSSVSGVTDGYSTLGGVGIDWNPDTEKFDIDNTVATVSDITDHNADTLNVHGITNTASLATQTDISDAVEAQALITTTEIGTHNSDTTNVHGIANTASLATDTDVSDAVAAQALITTTEIGTHNSDTTNVHGIANTASLETTTGAQDKADAAAASAVSTHSADTTSVHGIADTSALATKTYADAAVSTHQDDTTNVHGITDTAALATKVYADAAVTTHTADTTAVHGIADTSLLVTTTGTQTLTNKTITSPAGLVKADVGLGNVDNTADTSKPVSTAQASAIATAKSEAIADATSQVNALLTGAPAALNTLDELAAALGDDANFASSVTTSLGLKVDSLTPISQKTASYTLSSLTERDDLIEMGSASAITLTIPPASAVDYPIGTSIDILQTGAGQVTVAAGAGVTVNATPGLKLRTTWSSATLFKRAANTWVVFGDLTA